MRSRFTAYKLGGYGQYLIDTWDNSSCPTTNPLALDEKELDWQRLEIIDKSVSGDEGMVEFKAYYVMDNNTQACLHERSRFIRVCGEWRYTEGTIYS